MPKNKIGGKGAKKGKNHNPISRVLILKDGDEQCYAHVIKMLGDCRIKANCSDGVERICTIRGNMRKRTWINSGDLILVSLRVSGSGATFDNNKADVIHLYRPEEAKKLKKMGENVDLAGEKEGYGEDNVTTIESNEDSDIEFDDI